MPVPGGISAGEHQATHPRRAKLERLVRAWKDLRDDIRHINLEIKNEKALGMGDSTLRHLRADLRATQKRRRDVVGDIQGLVMGAPGLADYAVDLGFRADLLPEAGDEGTPSGTNAGESKVGGGTTPGGSGGGGGTSGVNAGEATASGAGGAGTHGGGGGGGGRGGGAGRELASRERLKNFKLVRLPSGRVMAIRTINIRGNKVQWGVWVDKEDFEKYGVKEKEIGSITKAQAKKIEALGNADELVFRGDDKNEFKAIVRGITRAHKGSPILEDDEVLGIIVAQSALGLTDSETQGLLKKTKWYQKSTEHEQIWTLDYSKEQRSEKIRSTRVQLIDALEDTYGEDWQTHLGKGAMKQVRSWAEKIASGELGGDPASGMARWAANQFDRAKEIEGTPAWITAQQELETDRAFMNRPEDKLEELRSQAMHYLGYDKSNTPRIDRGTLKQWAADLVSGNASEGDWGQFLRNQMKTLFPYFDPNLSFTEQASAYKSIAERTLGDTLDWNDQLLRDFTLLDDNGKPTDRAMSLHDFDLKVRQDNRAWKQGTALWDEGVDIVDALTRTMLGVG